MRELSDDSHVIGAVTFSQAGLVLGDEDVEDRTEGSRWPGAPRTASAGRVRSSLDTDDARDVRKAKFSGIEKLDSAQVELALEDLETAIAETQVRIAAVGEKIEASAIRSGQGRSS